MIGMHLIKQCSLIANVSNMMTKNQNLNMNFVMCTSTILLGFPLYLKIVRDRRLARTER